MTAAAFRIERLGTVMEPLKGDLLESGGVLNPGGARGPDGELYLFPRLVEAPNRSRVGIAKVLFERGEPVGVERLGRALEPEAAFERNPRTAGCEDARVTHVPALGLYVMVYSSYGPRGPRLALAVSEDCLAWRRLGPVLFAYEDRWFVDFNLFANKDACFFPEPVVDPDGELALALLHRPDFDVGGEDPFFTPPEGLKEERPGMWLSYVPLEVALGDTAGLVRAGKHRPLAFPEAPWEGLKIGGGTPPVRTRHGWLMAYHGVTGSLVRGLDHQPDVRYSAGAMVLDLEDPRLVLYRSGRPILEPEDDGENAGIVDQVVFPTALDARGDGRVDVYYGMADYRIGAGRLDVPADLP